MVNDMKIGIIGYSKQEFNEKIATAKLCAILYDVVKQYKLKSPEDMIIVSGLSNIGISKIAYEVAQKLKVKTVGIAPKEVFNYELFEVDEQIIVGEKFGDESETFIDYIDILIKIGGGAQSIKEKELALEKHKTVIETEV